MLGMLHIACPDLPNMEGAASHLDAHHTTRASTTHMQVQLTSNQPNMHDANIGMGMGMHVVMCSGQCSGI